METTISQKRSRFALEQLERIPVNKDFANLTAGLPAMILGNGFGHALAFLISKATKDGQSSEKHSAAFAIIARWLKECGIIPDDEPKSFLTNLSAMSQEQYLRAQDEALLVLEWVKRYANSALFLEEQGETP